MKCRRQQYQGEFFSSFLRNGLLADLIYINRQSTFLKGFIYSRLKWITIAGVLVFGLFQGCSNDNPISFLPNNSEEMAALAKKLPNANQKNRAIKKATHFLSSEGVLATNADWAANAKIVDAFPVYMDGIDDVCYYECKVQANGKDAGYILVNINRTDVQFPSYSTEGKTASEEFASELGTTPGNLQVFRHNWYEMLAEKKGRNGLGDGTIAIERGFDGSGYFKKGNEINRSVLGGKRAEFARRVRECGGVHPGYTRQQMTEYYMRDSVVQDTLQKLAARGLSKAAASYRWISDELNGTFATGWHLPQWTQVTNATGMLTGCGPLAVAMMYAYHRQFNGRTKLYNGLDLNSMVSTPWGLRQACSEEGSYHQPIVDVVFQIGADCHAKYGPYPTGTSTSSNDLENNGELYGDRLGYNVVMDWDWAGDFAKCKRALDHIRGERPVGVTIDSDGNGSIDHYVVAEGVKYCEKKDGISTLWSWWDYEAWYFINYGWGTHPRAWICAEANYGSKTKETQNGDILEMWFK